MFRTRKSRYHLLILGVGLVALVAIGIAIPKLTVRDAIVVDERLSQCARYAMNERLDNPFQRIALRLGTSRIVKTEGEHRITVEVFTLFRIPFAAPIVASCDQYGPLPQGSSVSETEDPTAQYLYGITEEDLPDGWYMRRSYGIDSAYMVLTRDPNTSWPQYELGEFGDYIIVQVFEVGDPERFIAGWVDCDDVAINRSCTWDFTNGRKHLQVEHNTPAQDARTDYFLDYGRVASATLYPLDSDNETKTTYARFLYNVVAPLVGTSYSRDVLRDNCTQEIPRELIDDSSRDTENGVVTLRWWDREIQNNTSFSVLYEPETDFAGCSESVRAFLRHLPNDPTKN